MGAITGLLGLNGGASGSGFAAPASAQIVQGVDQGQAGEAYAGSQNALQQQKSLLQALEGSKGIQNQQNVFQQYQNLANGVGANPAQAQLNQNTASNIAAQGALMAGQRGASQNAGLLARQIARQGAETQQQAAGQAATLGAQQQLEGLQGLQNISGNQVANQIGQTNALTGANQAQYGNVLNALNALNSTRAAMQGNINSTNAGLAQTSMQGQQGLIGGLLNFGAGAAGKLIGGSAGAAAMAGGGQAETQAFVGPSNEFGQFLSGGAVPSSYSKGGHADYREGGKVEASSPGEKAIKAGDNYSNDKIPAVLSEHEIVLPRSVTMSEDPAGNAANFVASVLAKRRGKK